MNGTGGGGGSRRTNTVRVVTTGGGRRTVTMSGRPITLCRSGTTRALLPTTRASSSRPPGTTITPLFPARHAPARHPYPAAVPVRPAAVMERREAPRGVVHPGPAPRLHPDPAAVAVRRPSHDRGPGRPDGTVVGRVAPLTVLVQVLVADGLGRHIARRARVVRAAVARGAPVLPVVPPRPIAGVGAGRVAARHDGRVP